METMNHVRGYHFLLGILQQQAADPFCRGCNAYKNTRAAVRDGLAAFRSQQADALRQIPPDFGRMFDEAVKGLEAIAAPGETTGQKKAGNCKLPEGHCFLKTSLAFFQRI